MSTNIARALGRLFGRGPLPEPDGAALPADAPSLAEAQAAPAPAVPPQPDPLQALYALSEGRQWQGLEEAALSLLRDEGADEALSLLAYGLQQQGRLEEAAHFAAVAARITPTRWLSQFIAGVAFLGTGRAADAAAHLRQALQLSPADPQTVRRFLQAVTQAEGVERAAQEYRALCEHAGIAADIVVAPVRSVLDWARANGVPVLAAGEVEAIPFEPPRVWGQAATQQAGSALSNEPYVADLANVRIFSNSGILLAPDGTALSDTGGDARFGHIVSFAYDAPVLAQGPGQVLLGLADYTTREIEEGMLLSGLASNAFGHWLPEFLPKLQFLQQHPDYARLPLVVDAGMPQAHFDHLRRLSSNPLVLLQAGESLLCKRLLVAPAPAFIPVEILPHTIPERELPGLSPRALRFLRGDAAPDGRGPGPRRIFLGRRKLQWRRLLNEEEIAQALQGLGFETVYIEDLGVEEQIALFRGAGWIVGPNGSALLNLVFADPAVKLLVLSQGDLFNLGTYQGPMEALGYRPLFVCGEEPAGVNNKHADYVVPLDRVLGALRDLGLEAPAP